MDCGTVIVLALAGSQAHGTAGEESDVDIRGVSVAPLSARLSLFGMPEQHEGALPAALEPEIARALRAHPTAKQAAENKLECVIFDVAKFLRLCIAANPNALEVLFADERDWLVATETWRALHRERHRFLTRKVQQTFLGYAMAQLRKIETHRGWLLNPPARKPTRADFGLPEAAGTTSRDDQHRLESAIADTIRRYGIDDLEMPRTTRLAVAERLAELQRDMLAVPADELEERTRAVATHALGLSPGVVATLNAEKRYRASMKQWDAYRAWHTNRNPMRADLERAHGYDTKHAMHLVRLMRMGVEALERGELDVRRSDAGELIAIREGAVTYEALRQMAEDLRQRMLQAAEDCTLPDEVDPAWVDAIALRIMTADPASPR
jgi:uncharacterized protein